MTITILKACVAFYSFIILKRLDKNNLDNFRTIEKLCKKYIKTEADCHFLCFI